MVSKTPSMQAIAVLDTARKDSDTRNRFESFEEFKSFVRLSFIEGSGIDSDLFDACIEFHQDLEFFDGYDCNTPIHDALNWEYKRFTKQANEPLYAAFLTNEDGTVWQAVLSLWDEEKQRPYRYLAPKGNGDRAFLPPVPPSIRKKIATRYGVDIPADGEFWEWVKQYGDKIPRTVPEGGKKGLALLSQGYLPLSLYGCQCGNAKNGDGVIDDLAEFSQPGTIWLLAFDQDTKVKAKKAVKAGTRNLTHSLRVTQMCWVESINWEPDKGKGVDDLIVNSGSGAFDNAYNRALLNLEKQFKTGGSSSGDEKEERNPSAAAIAQKIADNHRELFKYRNDTHQWMVYAADKDGEWSAETEEYIESIVYRLILADGITSFSSNYVSGIVRLLRSELMERKWDERPPNEVLPFTNGVLEIATKEFNRHAPGYRLTWQLPREYVNQSQSAPSINAFLDHLSGGNKDMKDILLCFLNAVLRGRSDLQKFLHLIGLAGTGKGTFARLTMALVGKGNCYATSLQDWCSNQFEGANAYKKRLVIFPDEEKWTGKTGKFLWLTGQDPIRAEEKRRTAFHYLYDGMVLMLSNYPVFVGGNIGAIKRREIIFPCNRVPKEVRNLEKEFEAELPAFTNQILAIPDEKVTTVLRGTKEIPECSLEAWESRMRVDALAVWINQSVIHDPTAVTPVGNNKNEGANGETVTTLFGSYSRHCHNLGDNPKSQKNFSPDLVETCVTVLGWKVSKRHSNTGKFVKGIRLRVAGTDDHIPTHDVYLMSRIKSDGLSDGSELLLHKESDGCDGLNDECDRLSDGLSDGLSDESQPLLHIESDGCDGKTEVNSQLPCEEAPVLEVEQSQPALPEPIKVKFNAPMGGIKAMATPIDCEKWSIHLMHPDATEYREEIKGGSRKVSNRLKALAASWQASVTYRVSRITQNGYEWVEGCKCVQANHTARGRNYIFESPAGESIQIYSERDIEIENKV